MVCELLFFLILTIGQISTATVYSTSRLVHHMAAAQVFEYCFGSEKYLNEKGKIEANYGDCKQESPINFTHSFSLNRSKMCLGGKSNNTIDDDTYNIIQNRLGNYSCILEKLGFVDERHTIRKESIISYVVNLTSIHTSVQEILRSDLENCYESSEQVPSRLIQNSIVSFQFLNENWIRSGIFMNCVCKRLMMTCVEKQKADQQLAIPSVIGLAMARIPFLTLENFIFEDLFTNTDELSLWFSYTP